MIPSQEIKESLVESYLEKIQIPSYILENLNPNIELRKYQSDALKYYLGNLESSKKTHLMFHMATGSGKTVIMASLILDCFARGYENFIFFVNSNAILEKTKQNFSNPKSSKYLFAPNIIMDSQNISINICENFNDCRKGQINIIFTTIQTLFSLLNYERENALTLSDFKDKKIVMLADEAHHINAETKKKSAKDENTQSWEGVSKAIYGTNKQNYLFEFSATLPKDKNVQEKYKDKIIFEYTLKSFREDRYSKEIKLLKYEGTEREKRIFGSVICSLYREHLAGKNNISLKPVILYKSKTIKESKENEGLFLKWLDDLNIDDLERFFANIQKDFGILYEAKIFFQAQPMGNILREIKHQFSKEVLINVNDISQLEKNQILLNTLEDKDNKIRVIFAVDKLNEGWDVLNLFDIVRLFEGSINDTPKEAQLIGRGARYFPFEARVGNQVVGKKNQRKFDDLNSPLKALETLTYHAVSENEFISRIQQELKNIGLIASDCIELYLKEEFKESEAYKKWYFAANEAIKIKEEIKNPNNINGYFGLDSLKDLVLFSQPYKIPLLSPQIYTIQEQNLLDENDEVSETFEENKVIDFLNLNENIILKAMNKSGEFYTFESLRFTFKGMESRRDFVQKYFGKIKLALHKKQVLNPYINLKIALLVCEEFKNQIEKKSQKFQIKGWHLKPLKLIGDKSITKSKDTQEIDTQDFKQFVFKNFIGTTLEKDFVAFIKRNAQKLNDNFSEWWLVRNDRNSEMALYIDGLDDEGEIKRFEPDFYFLAKPKGKSDFEILQCFIEPKGDYLKEIDRWKEEFLKTLLELPKIVENNDKGFYEQKTKVTGLPFFLKNKENEFQESFIKMIRF